MSSSPDLRVRSGRGWTIVEMAGTQPTPGTHDIGAPLGIAEGTMLLVILRAAERWAPDDGTTIEASAILRREGRMLVELSDGTTQTFDAGRDCYTSGRAVAGIVNIGVSLAEALVIAN
jgi:hypothetical protein